MTCEDYKVFLVPMLICVGILANDARHYISKQPKKKQLG